MTDEERREAFRQKVLAKEVATSATVDDERTVIRSAPLVGAPSYPPLVDGHLW